MKRHVSITYQCVLHESNIGFIDTDAPHIAAKLLLKLQMLFLTKNFLKFQSSILGIRATRFVSCCVNSMEFGAILF